MDSPNLHSRLKKLRQEKGYTQNDIAKKLDISRQAISRWENGHASPDIVNLAKLSEIYGISVDELLGTDVSDSEEKQEPTEEQEGAEKADDDTLSKISPLKGEYLLLLLILALTSYNSIIGFIVSCCIFIWTLLKRRNYKFLILLSVISIIHHLHNILVVLPLYISNEYSIIY